MKPLYITYSNGVQPYLRMAEEICRKVTELDAGDCMHICLTKPEEEKNFNIAMYSKIFAEAERVIADRPVIILDADHVLLKPIIKVFEGEWDIGAVYRRRCLNEYGRHDFCSGLVLLNNRRLDCITRFCHDWLTSMSSRSPSPGFCPKGLRGQGWDDTWFDDQTSLNEVIAVEDKVEFEKVYVVRNYRILPLHWKNYTRSGEGAFILHLKGGRKSKWAI